MSVSWQINDDDDDDDDDDELTDCEVINLYRLVVT